jgi:hypothetical protein
VNKITYEELIADSMNFQRYAEQRIGYAAEAIAAGNLEEAEHFHGVAAYNMQLAKNCLVLAQTFKEFEAQPFVQ